MSEQRIATTEPKGEKDPRALMTLAIENKADPAVLQKLMDLQERWDAMQAKKAYVDAMSEFKREVQSVLPRDAIVDFTSQKGRTCYRHATLGAIVQAITPALSKHGLSVSWETTQTAAAVQVICHVTHCEGHRESTALTGPPDDSGNKNKIQQIGSSVTYLQRYTLLAALGLATADQHDADDPTPPKMPTPKGRPDRAEEPPPEPPQPASKGGPKISEPQRKRLFAITKEQNVEPADLRNYLKAKYGIEHTQDILRADYEQIVAWVQAGGQTPPPPEDLFPPAEREPGEEG